MNARIERLKELLKQSPEDAFVQFALAKEWEKNGELERAIRQMSQLVEKQPDYVGAYYHLAQMLQTKTDFQEALNVYDAGIKIAQNLGDQHALGELQNARMNLEIEEDL